MQTVAKERSKLVKDAVPKRRSSKSKDIFAALSFIFTQPKEQLPMTEPDDESYSESEPQHSTKPLDIKFDKKSLRNVITAHGGTILSEFPTHNDPVSTLDTTLITVSDRRCITMNYLLSLAHSVPIVSHVYILDCVSSSSLLDRGAYLLPAGFSTLLMQEVEQGKDFNQELRINDCLLPSPPATSTRLSNRVKDEEANVSCRKILSGLHVLIISTDKLFTDDWQSVLDSLGAAVTKRTAASARLAQLRAPDVVVTDNKAPSQLCTDLSARGDIPVVSTNWVIQCAVNNGRIAFNNFKCKLPN
jgi:CheY-like chemotaxis protein